jgi:immunity protein 52 of polymorphic toxin system
LIESYYIDAYWGTRKESVEECTHRLAGFLMCLAECDPCFARWFKLGQSRQEALKDEIKLDVATLQTLLLAGRSRTDIGQKIMENLGFLIGLWNGASNDAESAGLMIRCGSYAPRPGFNSCVINLPYGETERERLLRVPVLKAVMECMVSAWDPDWSVLTSRQYQDKVPLPPSNAPRMGWILYLSSRRGQVPPLPSSTTVVRLGNQGTLVITTQERFTALNPSHVETASQIAKILAQAGLLGPLT